MKPQEIFQKANEEYSNKVSNIQWTHKQLTVFINLKTEEYFLHPLSEMIDPRIPYSHYPLNYYEYTSLEDHQVQLYGDENQVFFDIPDLPKEARAAREQVLKLKNKGVNAVNKEKTKINPEDLFRLLKKNFVGITKISWNHDIRHIVQISIIGQDKPLHYNLHKNGWVLVGFEQYLDNEYLSPEVEEFGKTVKEENDISIETAGKMDIRAGKLTQAQQTISDEDVLIVGGNPEVKNDVKTPVDPSGLYQAIKAQTDLLESIENNITEGLVLVTNIIKTCSRNNGCEKNDSTMCYFYNEDFLEEPACYFDRLDPCDWDVAFIKKGLK